MSGETDEKPAMPIGLNAAEIAIAYGGPVYKATVDDFNAAFDHISALLEDAVALYERRSFSTSAFVAITAIEETAKAEIAVYRSNAAKRPSKGRDPLRDHKTKHHIGVQRTVFMGERLKKALGEEICMRLLAEAEGEGFTRTREAALYCAHTEGRFVTPRTHISAGRARELLLLALETADDRLVGYTNHSMAQSSRIQAFFEQIATAEPK